MLFTRSKRDFSTVSHASDDERTKEKREEKIRVDTVSTSLEPPFFIGRCDVLVMSNARQGDVGFGGNNGKYNQFVVNFIPLRLINFEKLHGQFFVFFSKSQKYHFPYKQFVFFLHTHPAPSTHLKPVVLLFVSAIYESKLFSTASY